MTKETIHRIRADAENKTIKESRDFALDWLKNGFGLPLYVVEILNDSFIPIDRLIFENPKDAIETYNKLEKTTPPAFLRKYARIPF